MALRNSSVNTKNQAVKVNEAFGLFHPLSVLAYGSLAIRQWIAGILQNSGCFLKIRVAGHQYRSVELFVN